MPSNSFLRREPESVPERRLSLIHRVIVPGDDYPKEDAILVTERRSIVIRQRKTRSTFWLRGEMKWGTALVTDVEPKTLEDYDQTGLESLARDKENLHIPHDSVTALHLKTGEPQFFWPSLRRKPVPVYDFTMSYVDSADLDREVRFYMVPLGVYFKPRRLVQSRETILREYALDTVETFQAVLPRGVISNSLPLPK
jgi:hypothetical protein